MTNTLMFTESEVSECSREELLTVKANRAKQFIHWLELADAAAHIHPPQYTAERNYREVTRKHWVISYLNSTSEEDTCIRR